MNGIVPALLTPFDDQDQLDLGGLTRLIDRVLAAGVSGIFVAGTQGEFQVLQPAEHKRLIRAAVQHVDGRVPVFAGVSAVSTSEAVRLTRQAADAGADAVVSLPPLFPKPRNADVVRHFNDIAAVSDLPVFVYSHPKNTGIDLPLDLAMQLGQISTVAGFKDSSGDLAFTIRLRQELPADVSVFVGHDGLIAYALLAGIDGAVAATANAAPLLVTSIWQAVKRGDAWTAVRLQEPLGRLRELFSKAPSPVLLRAALQLCGHPIGTARSLPEPLPADLQQLLTRVLQDVHEAEQTC